MSHLNPYGEAELVQVRLLVELCHLDQLREAGELLDVPQELAEAFVTAGIAERL